MKIVTLSAAKDICIPARRVNTEVLRFAQKDDVLSYRNEKNAFRPVWLAMH